MRPLRCKLRQLAREDRRAWAWAAGIVLMMLTLQALIR